MLRRTLLIVVITALGYTAQSQLVQSDSLAGIAVLGRALPNSIMLRWAPTTPLAWQLANKWGYKVERFTVLRDGKVLDNPEYQILTPLPVKPYALNDWEELANSNKYGAIAAQAIYGETFEISNLGDPDIMQVYRKTQELELRYSFALFAADISRAVASASGLFYIDRTVKENEEYVYRVSTLIPPTDYATTYGDVLLSTANYKELPAPLEFTGSFEDKLVTLQWDAEQLKDYYSAYWIERSGDGGQSYQRITEEPYVITVPEGKPFPRNFYKMDSLPDNERTYYYRLIGVSPFGELSPASEPIKGSGQDIIRNTPYIVKKELINNQMVELEWEYPHQDSTKVVYYSLQRSNNAGFGYQTLETNIPWDESAYTDTQPLFTNYYRVLAHDLAGTTRPSSPVLVQLVDSIPPSVPANLVGAMDTTGLINISWSPNPDEDILGYRVYRANNLNEEFSLLNGEILTSNSYVDTLSLTTLSNKVYYRIMAIDLRQNHSAFSETLKVDKPDKVPPVSPVFKSVENGTKGIQLSWVNSTSTDVVKHQLYRANEGSNTWQLLKEFDRSGILSDYEDASAEIGVSYSYTLIAVDRSKLESQPAKPVRGQRIDTGIRPPVQNLKAKADRGEGFITLSWEYTEAGVEKYKIYRSENGGKMRLIGTVEGATEAYFDKFLKENTEYKYGVQAVFESGAIGLNSEVKIGY